MPRKKTPVEAKPVTNEDILEAVKSAKVSILRGMHSGDKVAGILLALVDEVRRTNKYSWICPECLNSYDNDDIPDLVRSWQAGGDTPICPQCADVDMKPYIPDLLKSQAWLDAEAYALRISRIKNGESDGEASV